jgi:hypothetical protein
VRGSIAGCTATREAIDRSGARFDRYVFDRCAQALDAAPPAVSFISPGAGSTVSGTVRVEAAATDDVRVDKVDLHVDGALYAIDLDAPYVFDWNTAAAAAGPHTLELRAWDIDGRSGATSRSVTVSTGPAAPDVVIRAAAADPAEVRGDWSLVADPTAAGGVRLWSPNRGRKLTASAAPVDHVDLTFEATAGVAYHLWLRLRADGNSYENDSVSVQFSDAVTASGTPAYRIGTSSALSVILEEGSGAGVRNWGWNDNSYGGLAAAIYFGVSGPQTMRIQVREDGASVDQIVLSPARYLTSAPGALKDDTTIVP